MLALLPPSDIDLPATLRIAAIGAGNIQCTVSCTSCDTRPYGAAENMALQPSMHASFQGMSVPCAPEKTPLAYLLDSTLTFYSVSLGSGRLRL